MDRMLVALAYASFACVALLLIRSDMAEHRLPNRVVLPGTAVIVFLLAGASVAGGGFDALARAVLGACVLCAFYLVLWGAGGGMGGGDVKLAVLVGFFLAWHGWGAFGLGAAAAFVLGGATALVLVAFRRATRRTRIAFGPFMLLGACLGPLVA
ncbi:prepilin peptidase [Microbacterium sp. JB110]|uniref:prepilin peptidase n=1 Tax=Microbacterium sp. JB110 TaxID=2024477 RepID=UPI00097F06A6|nr:prepilin peptidase [Microbacterium sp. JB110]RCS62716.1 prepilin peptidase [Microbacterium sp. JB110]SJM63241.1 putative type IV peptidase [Frigoribacterium sp. JB110]